jgi:hypothetical protein
MRDLRRREFISLLGRAMIAWQLGARAQPLERMRLVGVLDTLGKNNAGQRSSVRNRRLVWDRITRLLDNPALVRTAQEKAVQWAAPEERRDECLNHVCFSARSTR